MSSLVRPTIVFYRDASGHRVPKGSPNAKKVKKKASKWYGQYKDPQTGKFVRIPLYTDKEASRTKLAKIVAAVARGEEDMVDSYASTRNQNIQTAKQAWLDDLRQKGRDERYIYQQNRLVDKVLFDCKVSTLTQLTADKLDAFLQGLTCSARTKNTYRQACLGLMNFLVAKGKLPDNKLRKVTRAVGTKMRKRRALLQKQLQELIHAARLRPLDEAMTVRRGDHKGERTANVKPEARKKLNMAGRHRALLYLTALHTGLRRSELAELQVNDLRLEGATPFWELDETRTKNKQIARIPLRADLVEELQSWIKDTGKEGTDKVFNIPPSSQTNRIFRKDLQKAGIPYRDETGRYFDFHALRKCTGSFLRQAKIDPSVSKLYMRHSDIRLTMEIYNDEMLLNLVEAVDAVPHLKLE